MSRRAAQLSLAASGHHRSEIELLLYAGVYRSDFVFEPAIAAMIAGDLGINDDFAPAGGKRTLAFDVFNSSVGTLNACFVATQLIRGGKVATALVVAAEVENASLLGEGRRGVTETASALILDRSPGQGGFGAFRFRSFTDYRNALRCSVGAEAGVPSLSVEMDPRLEGIYVECALLVIRDLLEAEGLEIADIALVIPPPLSPASIATLSQELEVDPERFVQVTGGAGDLFTSSLPYALDAVRFKKLAQPGDIGLIIAAGAGIEIGCAIYYF